ncbi:Maturation and nuclear export of 40S ribosomal subunits interacting protein [Coemansia sp. RSA 2704]|nr:Maturation and nuclear export of 40S ribosomal subunits interacting protein [Coemansia sp. RSA 2704]
MSLKRKHGGAKNEEESRTLVARVHALEQNVLSSHQHLNDIVEIQDIAASDDGEAAFTAATALGRIYAALWAKGLLQRAKTDTADAAAQQVGDWLRDQYRKYTAQLRAQLAHSEAPVQVAALRLLLQMLDKEGAALGAFPSEGFQEVVAAVLGGARSSEHLLRALAESYVNSYDDLRLHFYRSVARLASPDYDPFAGRGRRHVRGEPVSPAFVQNAHVVLGQVRVREAGAALWVAQAASQNKSQGPSQSKSQGGAALSAAAHTRAFSEAWLAFLRLPLTPDIFKQVLLTIHKRVIPHMGDAKQLMDFLSSAYEAGGAVSLLALNGLFTLISEHNLNYPQFYEKLYALLDRNLFHVKYRARFFRLLEVFLASSHLPAYLIAAFAKRLARLALFAPPAGAVTAVAMVYNLLKQHPSCMVLIHRMPEYDAATGEEIVSSDDDPYDAAEPSPAKSCALQSSLWELETLQHHYYPNIATLARIFNEPFHKPQFQLEDFLDHTYATFFDSDTLRKPKKAPALATQPPAGLTRAGDALGDFMAF